MRKYGHRMFCDAALPPLTLTRPKMPRDDRGGPGAAKHPSRPLCRCRAPGRSAAWLETGPARAGCGAVGWTGMAMGGVPQLLRRRRAVERRAGRLGWRAPKSPDACAPGRRAAAGTQADPLLTRRRRRPQGPGVGRVPRWETFCNAARERVRDDAPPALLSAPISTRPLTPSLQLPPSDRPFPIHPQTPSSRSIIHFFCSMPRPFALPTSRTCQC